MTGTELAARIAQLGLSKSAAARRWAVPLRTLQRWCSGERPVPPLMPALLALEDGTMTPLVSDESATKELSSPDQSDTSRSRPASASAGRERPASVSS